MSIPVSPATITGHYELKLDFFLELMICKSNLVTVVLMSQQTPWK